MNNDLKENVEVVEEKSEERKINKSAIIKYIVYIFFFVVCLILKNNSESFNFVLGDFGSIVPLLLQTVALMGLKWVPVFCIAGVLVTKFENIFKDFSNTFLTVVVIVAITTIGLLLFL